MIKEDEIEVLLHSSNIKHYENLGYEIPRRRDSKGRMALPRGTKLMVRVEDIPHRSSVKVTKICDYCGSETPNVSMSNLTASKHKGKDRCWNCAIKEGINELHTPKGGDSFGDMFPELVKEVYEGNPYKVTPYSGRSFIWVCDKGHRWKAQVRARARGTGCPQCAPVSKGQERLGEELEKLGVTYEREKTFPGLMGVGGGYLRFDYYLPEDEVVIEYDGEQHEKPVDFFGGEEKFKVMTEHDRRKEEYCRDNGIRLIRIPYFYEEMIEIILYNIGIKIKNVV